jgi:hypothetical protein
MAVVGLGIGLVMQVLVLATQNAVDAKDLGVATSASSFFRSMGGAFGVAIFGSVFNNRLDHYLADAGPQLAGVDPAVLQSGPDALRSLPAETRTVVIDAFSTALHVTFLAVIPVAAIGFVVVLFLKELPLRESAHIGLEAVGDDLGIATDTVDDPSSSTRTDGQRHQQPPAHRSDDRPMSTMDDGAIVIGFDGTVGSHAALFAAIDLAHATARGIVVVHVEHTPPVAAAGTAIGLGAGAIGPGRRRVRGSLPTELCGHSRRSECPVDVRSAEEATRPTSSPMRQTNTPPVSSSSAATAITGSVGFSPVPSANASCITHGTRFWSSRHQHDRRGADTDR